jgi:hypothetical protein
MKMPLVIMLVITAGFIGASSNAQKPDAFADVPASQRERLKSRLSEFVELHRSKNWSRVYDLIAERAKNATEGGMPRDMFLKKKLYSSVRRFTPRSAKKIDDDWWIVGGCGGFDRGENIEAVVEAYFQDGDWYFSDIWGSFPCIDCMPKDCKH